ncbi:facilitated trehalose transporter Tret1-like [Anoplophora glabripennis]|uniref:facilitated trehalose transporter Tret1-like n=1 Tax=Anoplophora glabripennis TaxID=217634 RepID=UPI00087409BF|nr:facilitated trehalose transporter Tret1-like [Anoplophora glabripennis]
MHIETKWRTRKGDDSENCRRGNECAGYDTGTFLHLFITIGILYAQIFGYAVSLLAFHILMLAVPIVCAISFIFMPETPVYLIRNGKLDKVPKTFQFLRGKMYDFSHEVVIIEEQIAEDAKRPGFWVSMNTKASKKASLICLMLMFYQQFSGVIPILFFLNEIFTSAGSSLEPQWCVIIVGIVEVGVSIVSSLVMDKFGRKILLIVSSVTMAISAAVLGLFFTLKNSAIIEKDDIGKISFLSILSLMVFIAGFCFGIGPIPWMAPSELFAPEVTAKCSSAASTFNWLLAFFVSRFFLNVVDAIGSDATFYIFAGITATVPFFAWFLFPETKGKIFIQIKSELEGKSPDEMSPDEISPQEIL